MALALATSSFSYHKLKQEAAAGLDLDEDGLYKAVAREGAWLRPPRTWWRWKKASSRRRFKFRVRVHSLRRFWRRKVRVVGALRLSCAKVMRRLRESQSHFGDLFAGNYLFLQVNPTPVKRIDRTPGIYNGPPGNHHQGLSVSRVA